jgi:hypothetical protein
MMSLSDIVKVSMLKLLRPATNRQVMEAARGRTLAWWSTTGRLQPSPEGVPDALKVIPLSFPIGTQMEATDPASFMQSSGRAVRPNVARTSVAIGVAEAKVSIVDPHGDLRRAYSCAYDLWPKAYDAYGRSLVATIYRQPENETEALECLAVAELDLARQHAESGLHRAASIIVMAHLKTARILKGHLEVVDEHFTRR